MRLFIEENEKMDIIIPTKHSIILIQFFSSNFVLKNYTEENNLR